MSHDMPVIPLPVPQNLWSRSLRDLDHRFESPKAWGVLRTGVETNIPKPDQLYPRFREFPPDNFFIFFIYTYEKRQHVCPGCGKLWQSDI